MFILSHPAKNVRCMCIAHICDGYECLRQHQEHLWAQAWEIFSRDEIPMKLFYLIGSKRFVFASYSLFLSFLETILKTPKVIGLRKKSIDYKLKKCSIYIFNNLGTFYENCIFFNLLIMMLLLKSTNLIIFSDFFHPCAPGSRFKR